MRYGSFKTPAKCFEPPAPELVRDRRRGVAVVSWVELEGERMPVQISDVSENGLGGRSNAPLAIGAEALVALPQIGPVPVQIRWSLGGRFGARFQTRVEFDDLLAPLPLPKAE